MVFTTLIGSLQYDIIILIDYKWDNPRIGSYFHYKIHLPFAYWILNNVNVHSIHNHLAYFIKRNISLQNEFFILLFVSDNGIHI
jgi:hypothetical protein